MAEYRVECEGVAREIYIVDAESEEEAMSNWFDRLAGAERDHQRRADQRDDS